MCSKKSFHESAAFGDVIAALRAVHCKMRASTMEPMVADFEVTGK
jgi:hypothetical protein